MWSSVNKHEATKQSEKTGLYLKKQQPSSNLITPIKTTQLILRWLAKSRNLFLWTIEPKLISLTQIASSLTISNNVYNGPKNKPFQPEREDTFIKRWL